MKNPPDTKECGRQLVRACIASFKDKVASEGCEIIAPAEKLQKGKVAASALMVGDSLSTCHFIKKPRRDVIPDFEPVKRILMLFYRFR